MALSYTTTAYGLHVTCLSTDTKPTVSDGCSLQETNTGNWYTRTSGSWVLAWGPVPTGIIAMWSGLFANIPSGWLLCDGTSGTPDLWSQFVKGAAAGIDPGATGGAATHTPLGTVAAPTFTGDLLATHTHPYTQVVNHTHGLSFARGATTGGATTTQGFTTSTDTSSTAITDVTNNPGGGVASGTTSGTSGGTPTGTNSAPAFTGTDANTEPAYYSLAYIMKS